LLLLCCYHHYVCSWCCCCFCAAATSAVVADFKPRHFRYRLKKWYTNAHLICKHPCHPFSPLVLLEGFIVWLTWPIRVFLMNVIHKLRLESSHSHEKIDRHSKYQRAYQIYASRAHLIEVME
jgi:hypothetical protein